MAQPNGKLDYKPVSLESRRRMARARLSIKQQRFVQEYAAMGNAADAARKAGYKPKAAKEMGYENLTKPHVKAAVGQELARIALEVTPDRVRRRLDEISHAAQAAGQFGPSVRCEELLGKSCGMWIEQSIHLSGQLNDTHVQALVECARRRQQEPIDLSDDAHSVDEDE
jgi:phage terminase small subunit